MYKDELIKKYQEMNNKELKKKLRDAEKNLFADKITFTELGILCFEAAKRINESEKEE